MDGFGFFMGHDINSGRMSVIGAGIYGLFGLVAVGIFLVGSYQASQVETQTRRVETLREGDVVNFNNNQYILSEDDSHKPVLNPVSERPYEKGDLELKAEEE